MNKFNNKYVKRKASRIQGSGVFAKCFIPKHTQIIEYTGERLTKKQSEKILEEQISQGKHIYIFSLNSRYDIDGDTNYNLAKYINHSCEPNCYAETDAGKIWIVAKRDIQKGEELAYDYGFARPNWQNHPCCCNADNCFGFIVARDHWSSIRKTKLYQSLLDS